MKRVILIGTALLLLILGVFAYQKYQAVFAPNVPQNLASNYLHISTGSDYQDVFKELLAGGFLRDTGSFTETAALMKFDKRTMRAGRFELQGGWSNRELIQHLRTGKQSPVKIVLTNRRLLEEVAAKVATFIEADSLALISLFQNDAYLKKIGFTQETLMSLFIPNTYEFYWNTSAEAFVERMIKEHQKFWEKDNRIAKAEQLELTKEEVYTLASIVEKETNQNSEKQRMAGVYVNRVELGMLLQADPTCVFATRDFDTKRVTNYHTSFDSPYNTYLYPGIPPGPIAMASIASIDAVLNKEEHKYLFFCARGDESGLHNFAKNMRGHNQNINIYKRNLRKRGLR